MKAGLVIFTVGIVAAAGALFFDGTPAADTENIPMNNVVTFTLSSPAFENGGTIPAKYTCDGDRALNPPLTIANVPEGAKSLVLLMDDPDIPQVFKDERGVDSFDHWVVYGIPPETRGVGEGELVGTAGLNGSDSVGYTGPCPPPEYEPTTHRYVFKLHALYGSLQFSKAPTKAEVEAAMHTMTLGEAMLVGVYDRSE